MKTIRFVALILTLVLAAASVSAYVGECPVGMEPTSCCSTMDHCTSDGVLDRAMVVPRVDISGLRTGICQLALSELWRDAAAKTEDTAPPAILPQSRPALLNTSSRHILILDYATFVKPVDHLRTVVLRL